MKKIYFFNSCDVFSNGGWPNLPQHFNSYDNCEMLAARRGRIYMSRSFYRELSIAHHQALF